MAKNLLARWEKKAIIILGNQGVTKTLYQTNRGMLSAATVGLGEHMSKELGAVWG